MELFQTDAMHFLKCMASTTQARGTFARALHFDLTWWRRYWNTKSNFSSKLDFFTLRACL